MKKVFFVALAALAVGFLPAAHADGQRILTIVGEQTRTSVPVEISPWFDKVAGRDRAQAYETIISLGFSDRQAADYVCPGLGRTIAEIFLEEERPARDATLRFDANNVLCPFEYRPHTVGKSVNKAKFRRDFADFLSGKTNEIRLEILKVQPRTTTASLVGRTKLLGTYKTDFSRSGTGRRQNVLHAAGFLNGKVIMPGQVASFNEMVGPRTAERGFAEANVIVGGRYVPGIGGGVCQVSTTLYNAVIRAGLCVREVRNHSLAPTYVPPSLDAMVSESSDFKFVNNTGAPVYIVADAQDGVLQFWLYGREERNYRTEYESRIVAMIEPPPSVKVLDETLPDGAVVIERALQGVESEAYEIRIFADGTKESVLIRRDKYKAKGEIVRHGKITDESGGERLISGKVSPQSG